MSQQLLRPGGGLSSVLQSLTAGAVLGMWDPWLPYTMRFRPVRKVSKSAKSCFIAPSHYGGVFDFQGSGATKLFISGWFRIDTASGNMASSDVLIASHSGASKGSWVLSWATNGATRNLSLVYFNSSGNFVNLVTISSAFPAAGAGDDGYQWVHLVLCYDGSLSGNTNILKVWVNNVAATVAASPSLPAQLGTHSSTLLRIGAADAVGSNNGDFSFCDVALCAAVPDTPANAVADLWNNGEGRRKGDWPSSCPPRLAYYSAEDSYTDGGTVPSGDLIDAMGSYNLTQTSNPGGGLMLLDWRDVTRGFLMRFGYNRQTGYRQRNYEAEYLPTGRFGTMPGVYCRPARSGNGVRSAWGYCGGTGIDFKALMGAAGSMFGNCIASSINPTTANDWLTVCDDIDNLGTAGQGQDKRLSLATLWNNAALVAAGNKAFACLHTFNGSGNPITYTPGDPCDMENITGNEVVGTMVAGANYPTYGDQLTLLASNLNDGTSGSGATPGPYRLRTALNGSNYKSEQVYVDDGGAGISGNIWASRSTNLSALMLNGYATIVNGNWTYNGIWGNTFGPFGILAGGLSSDQLDAVGAVLAGC